MKKTILALSLLAITSSAMATKGYYRSPTIHQNTLVFTAEGDLWKSSLDQKKATRLTTHASEEIDASISPDGQWVAYSADYDGAREVYVISIDGGLAKRVSFENSNVKVHGWTAKGDVLYSTNNRVGPTGNWTLRTANPDTLVSRTIELADAVEGSVDQQGKYIYFVQFGLQVSTDNVKYYRGGAKGELWRFDLSGKKEAEKLTKDHQGSVREPMVDGNKVYFISDASGNENIWSMNLDGSNAKQVTRFNDWPVRNARLADGKIVYQLAADIRLLDLSNGSDNIVDVELTSDLPHRREKWINNPLEFMTNVGFNGEEKKAVITARGKIAVANIDESRLVEIATPADSRSRKAILSHDGKWVYAINDSAGELEIWQYAADGSSSAKQLTNDGNVFRWNMQLSPDGKYLAHDDKNGRLYLLNLESGDNKLVIENNSGFSPFEAVVWSPDSKYLALTVNQIGDERSRVQLYAVEEGKSEVLTSDRYMSGSPTFSQNGEWLYFLSERNFKSTPTSPWGDRNLGPMFDRRSEVYAYQLVAGAKFPFSVKNELLSKESSKEKKEDTENQKAQLNWKGLNQRLWHVPVPAGNYGQLKAADGFLYVMDQITEPNAKAELKAIKIAKKPKVESFKSDVSQFQVSADGKSVFVVTGKKASTKMFIVKAGAKFPKDTKDMQVQTKAWQMLQSPVQEWQQIFHDTWLMHRDSLYDKNLRGLDWVAVKEKYQPLLGRVTDRHELNDIFKQMIGELNALHSQVRGGEVVKDKNRPKVASLGATYNQTDKGVVIEYIYQTNPELPQKAAPLAKPGVDAEVGDIITHVNGAGIDSIAQLTQLLRNKAGKQILLTLQRGKNTLKTVVVPGRYSEDYWLRYSDWTLANQYKVEKANEDIGYLHVHSMGAGDISRFADDFYAQFKKQGLIIDVRRNRGGNIDSWLIEKLLRRVWMFWEDTNGGQFANMQQTFRGHLVVLADEFTYSDGETFTAGVKALNLGPVIGKQTAGAGVWLTGRNRVTDGGISRVAELPVYAMDGRWITEGVGVKPTIEVDNLPHATFNGDDAQLAAAIDYLNKQLKDKPVKPLQPKPFPSGIDPADDIVKD